ncbi:MAG: TRAP transporter TatT component family protein [Oligoflexia bacterium]|nr:TRAP transporter TatT component family protein [Oligoflexia bacterium]
MRFAKPFLILTLALAAAGTSPAQAKALKSSALSKEIEKADRAFQQRGVKEKAREAHERYRALHYRSPSDPELAWRFAMASYFVGLRLTQSDDDKERLFAEGRDAGKAGIAAAADCTPCHFWTAINMALYGQTVGPVKMLFSLKEIRAHLQETVRLDPAYASAGAQRLLGLIEQKLPGILGGDNARAKAHLEQAIAVSPDEPLNYLFLARLLHDELDEREGALAIARKGMGIAVTDPSRIESIEARATLQEFVKTGKWKYN